MNNINYDLHIHTEHCGHAKGTTVEKILQRADEMNLQTICIADHIYSPKEMSIPAKIKEQVNAAPNTKCRILVGAEIDVNGLYFDGRLVCPIPENLDYIIAGVHFIPGPGHYPWKIEDNTIGPDAFLERYHSTLAGVLSNDQIDALAHPARMPGTALNLDVYFDAVLEILRDVAPLAAKNKILWEINEHDKDKAPPEYHDKWYKIYEIALEAGVKLVYGSDAHFVDEIGRIEFVSKVLEKLPKGCLNEGIDFKIR
ncbi:MAG: PHP domain-containing protein [Phycisphaerae bacterium]